MQRWLWLLFCGVLQGFCAWGLPTPWHWFGMNALPLVFGLGMLARQKQQGQVPDGFFSFYVVVVGVLGPFATWGALWSLIFLSYRPKSVLSEYQEYIEAASDFSELDKIRFQRTQNLWADHSDYQLEPFVDIMRGTETTLKQSVIDKVVQHPSPVSARVLRQGLKDENHDIRYYAASGWIQLNDLFQKRLQDFKKKVHDFPDDPKSWEQLGLTYDQYCFLDLPSEEDQEVLLDQAEVCYRRCLEIQPDHELITSEFGRLLIKRHKTEEALHVLQQGMHYHPHSLNLLGWMAEALYEGKRFAALQKQAWDYLTKGLELPDYLEEAFSYWAFVFAFQDDPNLKITA